MSETEPPKITRRQHITREEEADRCLNNTVFTKGSQLVTILCFLAIVFGVPVVQHIVEIRQNIAKRAEWSPKSGRPEPGLAPQIYDVLKLLPSGEQVKRAKGFWGYWSLIPSTESISAFETSLKENSVLTTNLLSPTQLAMTKFLGAGNEKAYVGRDGWLFYRPDVEYLTTAGFLDPARLKGRLREAKAIQPDPLKAILDFKEQLYSRGIELVVVPISTKPMIQPEMLAGPMAHDEVLQNDSFDRFKDTLEANGVRVYDPTPNLLKMSSDLGKKLYLQTDTHWTPPAMHQVAIGLGDFLVQRCGLKAGPPDSYALTPQVVSNLGDIAEMLKLPSDQNVFQKQNVTAQTVMAKDGSPWQADPASEVLLLGDSFSNIYSLGGMGWGTGAGFAEHLSFATGKAIDKIAINAGGAFASRQDLARQLARGVDRLAGKKIVVYEFSMRDLAQGDWKMIHLTTPPVPVIVIPRDTKPPVAKLITSFQNIVVTPNGFDPTKGQNMQVSVTMPPCKWTATVLDDKGNLIRTLAQGTETAAGRPGIAWTGQDEGDQVVKPGTYLVKITGQKPDGTVLEPITDSVVVQIGGVTSPPAVKPPTAIVKPANPTKPAHDELVVSGRIASRAATPKPGSVPYKDCVIALQLTDLKSTGGTVKGQNIVVYVWGMRDNKLVDGAYAVGQTVRFKLVPWASVDSKYGGYNRQELESDDALSWEAFWGEIR